MSATDTDNYTFVTLVSDYLGPNTQPSYAFTNVLPETLLLKGNPLQVALFNFTYKWASNTQIDNTQITVNSDIALGNEIVGGSFTNAIRVVALDPPNPNPATSSVYQSWNAPNLQWVDCTGGSISSISIEFGTFELTNPGNINSPTVSPNFTDRTTVTLAFRGL
jgi:hypothetical protein